MPYHKSCEKRIRSSRKRYVRNTAMRSTLKTSLKAVLTAKDKTTAMTAIKKAYSVIDKSLKAGIIPKNNAANKKARLALFVNKMQG